MTTGSLALIILAAILAQITILVLLTIYRRRRQYQEQSIHTQAPRSISTRQAAIASVVEPVAPTIAWEGFRSFSIQHREFEDGNRSICSFYLVPVDGRLLPPFKPGQYLTFKLQIEDPSSHELKSVVRCYSLSDKPSPDYYRISVKRVPAPADQPTLPPGLSSNYFHDHAREGDRLLVKAPSGHFHLMEDEPMPVVLIGGGIGVTPMLSTLNTVLESGIQRDVWFYYGVRNGTEQIMKEHLRSLAKAHDNLHLHVCYSAPAEEDIEGVDYQHGSRVDIPLLRATLKMMRYQFYVCGPRQMMESLVPGLEEWGVDSNDIYYESFGPATLVKHEKPETEPEGIPNQTIEVAFGKTGKRVPWNPEAGSLLEFTEAQGILVESGCRAGSCGCCQTALETGEVEYSQQPDVNVEPGHCLLCISTPKGDIRLAI